MNNTSGEEPEVSDLWMDLQDLEDDVLEPGRREELMRLLDESPAARRTYFEYFQQSAVFKMEGAKMHEQGLLPVADLSLQSRRLFQRSILAAAAVILALAVVATLIAVKQPEPGLLRAAVAADTQWSVDGVRQDAGTAEPTVVEGSSVQVQSGTVSLTLESGARIVLQGPTRASFPDLRQPVLKSGWLWIDSGEREDESFAVAARGLVVRDIGTRFGVRVPEGGPLEVHLVDGKVVVEDADGSDPALTLVPSGRGQAIHSLDKVESLDLDPDPFPGLAALLEAPATYQTTVRSQGPVGYWRLDDTAGRAFANEILDDAPAGSGLVVTRGEAGPRGAGGFHGFDDENLAVLLTGDAEKSVLLDLDSGRGVSRREGAVSFWIRRPAGLEAGEALWLAGETYSGRITPEQAILFTELTGSGHVRFCIENGKFDVALTSTRSIADGGWHHVVASWGPSSVDLFIDGKLAARDVDSRILKEGTFSGRYVRFGKPSLDLRASGMGVFKGWVDEITLWNRPLSHAEVSRQFQSARGE